MPSEAAKKRQAQKKGKRQASSRGAQKRTQLPPKANGDQETEENVDQGQGDGGATASSMSNGVSASVNEVSRGVDQMKLSPRSCTGEY